MKYKPDKDLGVDVDKLLGKLREEEEVKMIIFCFLRKSTSPELAEEFRKTHLRHQVKDYLKETTFTQFMKTRQDMQQNISNLICIDDDEDDDDSSCVVLDEDSSEEEDSDDGDDDVVLLDDDDVVILENLEILSDESEKVNERSDLEKLEANIVHEFLKLVSTELAENFKETFCQSEIMPVQLEDFVDKALRFNIHNYDFKSPQSANVPNHQLTTTTPQSDRGGSSRLGMLSKRFTEEEERMVRGLMRNLGQRQALKPKQRRMFSAEEEKKIEHVALRMNRSYIHIIQIYDKNKIFCMFCL